MKKFALLIAIGFAKLWAAPVGNTYSPAILYKGFFSSGNSWINFRVGYEGDFVADGRMKQFDQGTGRVDVYHQYTNSGTCTFSFVNRVDLYGVLGSSKAKADWRFTNPSTEAIARIVVETEYSFLWAVGGRAILFEWGKASLGIGGRYSWCDYSPGWLTSDGAQQVVDGSLFRWDEWQLNFDLCYKIKYFVPYIGVKHSNARAYLNDFLVPISQDLTGSNSLKNRVPLGLYLGCAISNGNYLMVNVEGRLTDEEAVTISADLKF